MIKNIIFDLGGVILKHKALLLEEKIAEIFAIPLEQAAEIWGKERILLLTGQSTSEHFLEKLKNELGSEKSTKELLAIWEKLYKERANEVDWELLDLVEKLREYYKVYLLSDTIDTHDEYNSERGIYAKFTAVFRSNVEGLTKLNNDAFINLFAKTGAIPKECLFIDDLATNVKRAQNLGMAGIVYKDLGKLKEQLRRFGIKATGF